MRYPLKRALALALLLHVVALAVLARLSLAEARTGNLEEIQVFGAETPVEVATTSLAEMAPSPALPRKSSPAPLNFTPDAPDNSEEWAKPDAPVVSSAPKPVRPATARPHPEPAGAPAAHKPEPTNGGASGAPTPGGPLNLGPASPAGTVPVATNTGPATPAGIVPGEGRGVGAGTESGNGDHWSGGNGTGPGTGSGSGRSGPGTGEGPDGKGPGSEPPAPASRPKLADWAEPKLARRGTLVYPEAAIADGAEGTCVLKVVVSETGEVAEVEVTHSTGDRRLDKAAREYVSHFQYQPAVQNGQARRVTTTYKVEFSLK